MLQFISVVIFSVVLAACASAPTDKKPSQLEYTYKKLKLMDLDDMSNIMVKAVQQFKQNENPEELKAAFLIAFSRPDEDSVLEKVISTIRTPMEDREIWESSIDELVSKAINVIENDDQPSVDQVTYSVALENLISELKPEFLKQSKSRGFETRIIERIAQAKIELTDKAESERRLNLMRVTGSPSQLAQKLVERRDEAVKKEKEQSEKVENPE